MDDYLRKLLGSNQVYLLNDNRSIITDRMGPWKNQNVDLVWENAYCSEIAVTPDEAEILFEKGKTKNVQRDFDGKLCMGLICCDARSFDGAIICGILSPRTNLRQGILDYAKKMGYISDTMVPVEMFNGTKSLTCHTDGTYTVKFKWSEKVEKNAELENFTKVFWEHELATRKRYFWDGEKSCNNPFYNNAKLTLESDGFSISGLAEQEVFSRNNIDTFRVYDIQLFFLDQSFDKDLLFKAFIQFGFATDHPFNLENLYNASRNEPHLYSLNHSQVSPTISSDMQAIPLKSGTIYFRYQKDENTDIIYYKPNVPYSESLRTLMKNFEGIAKFGIKGTYLSFSPYAESVEFMLFYETLKNANKTLFRQQALRELITLDYSIYLLEKCKELNNHNLYSAILKLFSRDANFSYEDTFMNYFKEYSKLLTDNR